MLTLFFFFFFFFQLSCKDSHDIYYFRIFSRDLHVRLHLLWGALPALILSCPASNRNFHHISSSPKFASSIFAHLTQMGRLSCGTRGTCCVQFG